MAGADQRTEQPTPRRLRKARGEGRFPSSREFVSAVQFAVGLAFISLQGETWLEGLKNTTRYLIEQSFRSGAKPVSIPSLVGVLREHLVWPMLATGGAITLAALAAQLISTSFGFGWKRLTPDLSRLNPAGKLQQLPKQNLPQLGQAVVLIPLILYLVYSIALDHALEFLRLPAIPLQSGVRMVAGAIDSLLWRGALILGMFGLYDFWRQRKNWMAEMKMSKQEIRDEAKEVEGNPAVKSKIRKLMREMSRRRMMKDVESATTVIVNPTHFSVALRYQPESMAAPQVVAKGKNLLARMIRERAVRHQVPVVENPPLARALYQSAQVGQEIPAHLYRAVAEVLAYIFRLMNGRI